MLALQISDTELEERFASLTGKQVNILRDAAAGYSNRQIGERNTVQEGTVKQHLSTVYKKLKGGQKCNMHRALAAALLQRHDALPNRWRDNIWIQGSVVDRCPEQGISAENLADLVIACFQNNVEELTLRFPSLNLKALKMKDRGGTECLLIVDRD